MPQSLRQHLLDTLKGLPQAPRYWVAFSGGLDSTVLLHLLTSLRDSLSGELRAVHVDHGLSEHSADWSAQCRRFCEVLDVPLTLERVEVEDVAAKGLEAAARRARYTVFERLLAQGELLLTAHHRDDQAETLLLQLLRGGGVHGLAAMPLQRPLGEGLLARPLLDLPRERLRGYAGEHDLNWIDDPSNFDTSLERNFLRHDLLPQLAERRSGIREVLARSAGHFAESARLLDELAEIDRQYALREDGALAVSRLMRLSAERCRNLLRFHFRQAGLPLPQHKHLQRILDELLPAAEDAEPLVAWPGAEVRRYRDGLYVMAPLPSLPAGEYSQAWRGEDQLALQHGLGRVRLERTTGRGLSARKLAGRTVELSLRHGGERLRLPGRDGHQALKKLYQEAGVPPWERDRRPLLYVDGHLAQVSGYWSCAEWTAEGSEEGLIFQWAP